MTRETIGDPARRAVDEYARYAWGMRVGEMHPDELPLVVADLLCDLRRYCDDGAISWHAALERSEMHYDAEATAAVGKGENA